MMHTVMILFLTYTRKQTRNSNEADHNDYYDTGGQQADNVSYIVIILAFAEHATYMYTQVHC